MSMAILASLSCSMYALAAFLASVYLVAASAFLGALAMAFSAAF